MNNVDCIGNVIEIGDRVCFYWSTKFFAKMVSGIVVDIHEDKFVIQTGNGIMKRSILEIVKVG